ncbi:hypothetical protein [Vreelandella sp.]|uniref:hypothetical protein n=1 Tax=Vreelandella sp. TaxID=3137778 RepID=UPI003BABF6E8
MAQTYKTGLIITGDASGGIRAIKATEDELGKLNQRFDRGARQSKQFGADASRAGQQLRDIDTGANEASQGLEVLRSNVVGVAAAMATAFGANSIIQQAQLIADTDSLAQSIGVATGELQAWDYAAQQAGLAQGQIGDILKDVTERIGEFTAEGTGEAAALFENLNLNIEEMKRLSPDQQLLRIAEAISTLETRGEKISYLERLGNDATRLLPLLDNNAALLREYTNEAQALGVAMSQVDIENAVQANRAMAQLTGTMDGFKNQIAADLGPGLAEAVGGLTAFIQEAGGASSILNEMKDVAAITAAVLAGRYAAAMVTATQATLQKLAADRAAATQTALSMEAEAGRAAMQARTAAAEKNTAAVRATIAAQEAAQERAAAAQDVQRLQRLQAQLAAEKTLAAQRLAEQSNAAGRMQVQTRINQLHTAELSATNQLTAANARLTQAEATSTSAKRLATAASIEKTRADTAAIAAVGSYTAATHAATSANTLLAASGRAAASALALVGGPLGLLVGAGGLMYLFRDELGLTTQAAGLTEQQISDLRSELKGMSQDDLSDSLDSLNRSLEEATLKAASAREELAKLRAERDQGEGPRAAFRQLEAGGYEAEARGIRAVEEAEERLVEIEQRRNTTYVESIRRWKERRESKEQDSDSTTLNTVITEASAAAARDAANASNTLGDAYQSLLDRITPNRREARQYAQDLGTLNLAFATGSINTVQYMQQMGRLQESFQASQRETGNVVKEVTEQNNQAAQDLGFAFESAFENAILQGEALRSVLGGIAQDIARITLRQTVTAPIGNWVSGAVGGLFGGSTVAAGSAGAYASSGFIGQIGFSEGGYTGAGGRLEPAGIVHRGEFVVQKSVVERPGVRPMLEALNQGVAAQFANGGYVVPDSPPAIPTLGLSQGYADGGYVSSPGPVSLERFHQNNHTTQQSVSLSVSVPVTVHAAPGMNQEQAQQQGQTIGQSVEGAVVRVLQKQMRPGGLLYRK